MPKLPAISGRNAIRAFERDGWRIIRQHSSHIILGKVGSACPLSVPDHRVLKHGTLRALIRQAGLTPEAFDKLLKD